MPVKTTSAWGIDPAASGATRGIKLSRTTGNVAPLHVGNNAMRTEVSMEEHLYKKALPIPLGFDAIDGINFDVDRILPEDEICLSFIDRKCTTRSGKLPPVEESKIPDIVQYAADQQIPFDLDEVHWDYITQQSDDTPDVEYSIFSVKREVADQHLSPWNEQEVDIDLFQPSGVAILNALTHDKIIESSGDDVTVIIVIDQDDTSLLVVGNGTFWSRTIPMGYINLAKALMASFKLSETKALNLIFDYATKQHAQQIGQSLVPVLASFTKELSTSLNFYKSGHQNYNVAKIVLVREGAILPCMRTWANKLAAEEIVHAETPEPAVLTEKEDIVNKGAYWAAYGLALGGVGLGKFNVHLLPENSTVLGRVYSKIGNVVMVPVNIVRKSTGGFTLVEFLVALSIMGLLVSFLLPALKKAKEAGITARAVAAKTSSAVITIENGPDGKIHISAKYHPDFDPNIETHDMAYLALKAMKNDGN